jgi:hypothetical protein
MRHTLVGAVLMAGLVIAATAGRGASELVNGSLADPSRVVSGELITHVTVADGGPQMVTVIDPRQRVLAVYHVERSTGQITFMSSRNITWDLQMMHHNSGDPLPQDVRSALQHR